MTGWTIGAIALLLIVAFCFIRVGARASYDGDGAEVSAKAGPFWFKLFPVEKKKSESKEKKKVSVDGKKPGADTEVFKSMLGDLIRIGGKLLRGVRIDLLELDFTVASEDPYNTALLFGGGSAAAGIIISIIQNNFVLKKKKISVKADFEADKTLIHCKAELSVPIWRLIAISIMLAAAYISKRNESVNN